MSLLISVMAQRRSHYTVNVKVGWLLNVRLFSTMSVHGTIIMKHVLK